MVFDAYSNSKKMDSDFEVERDKFDKNTDESPDQSNFQIISCMIDFLIAKLAQNFCKRRYIQDICEERRAEGYMINQSLGSVREMFNYILYKRNSGRIVMYPPHFEFCNDQYQTESGELFRLGNSSSKSDAVIGSIFNKIHEMVDGPFTNNQQPRLKTKLNQLILSVFCVLTWSMI